MGVAQRRARLALVSAVAVVGAACAAPSDEPESDTSNAASSTSTTPDDPTPSATYAVHEVDPPGEFTGIDADDMLLESTDTIPERLVEQIKNIRLDGRKAVSAVTPLSLSSFSLENRNYRIAAVDIRAYRRFTGPEDDGAPFQEAWDRVASGEVAVLDSLQGRIPLDKDGYLAVGSGDQRFPIHVGAWTSQVGSIDAVVNTAWGEALDLPENNALVISTGVYSPQAVKEKLQPLLDDNMAITDLDIVAEVGIEIGATRVALPIGTFSQAVGVYRYTPIGGGRVQPEAAWVRDHIVTEQMPILGAMTCNKFMMPQLREALIEIQTAGLASEIHPDEYAGCYYPRFIAGSTTLSNHSFGLAFDINTPGNQRGTVGQISRAVVAIFKKWGFAWGGDWSYTDPMHFELARIVHPG